MYDQLEYPFAVAQLVLAMLGMGATLQPKDFGELLRVPRLLTMALAMQLLLVPLLAFAFIAVFKPAAGLLIGIALLASIPGGTVSNIFTYFARGNTPLSIAATSLTSLACLLTTPLILNALISEHMAADFVMPTARVITEIALCLLLPLLLGMLFLHFYPQRAAAFSKRCVQLSLFFIVLMVVGSLTAGRIDLQAFGVENAALLLLFFVLLAVVSMFLLRLLSVAIPDRTAIEMELLVRNVNLALMIKASLFPEPTALANAVLFSVLFYGGAQLAGGAALIAWRR